MKVTSIDMSTERQTIRLNLNVPDSTDPYLIKSILGLDADEIVARFINRGLDPEEHGFKGLYDVVLPKREVVIQVLMNPRYATGDTYSKLRDTMYKLIAANRRSLLTLIFNDGSTQVAKLEGFVTKLEAPNFTDTQELTITMNCKDPILRGINQVIVDPTSLLNSTKLDVVDSLSTAPHGLTFTVEFNAFSTLFRMWNVIEAWEFYVNYPSPGFIAGDRLRFGSEHNQKYLYLNNLSGDPNYTGALSPTGSPLYSIIDKIEPFTTGWPYMYPGTNTFNFDRNANHFGFLGMRYYPAYWGV